MKRRLATVICLTTFIVIQGLFFFTALAGEALQWQQRSPLPQGYDFLDLAAGNGVFVGVGYGPMNTTTNGLEWELQAPGGPMYHVSFGNGLFIGDYLNRTIVVSSNAIDWASFSLPITVEAATYGDGYIVAGGYDSSTYKIVASNDGTNWSPCVTVANNPFQWQITQIIYAGGKYVATGHYGNIYVSSNLTDWVTVNTGGGEWHADVCYGNGLYVTVGSYNGVFTSSDAVHWTQRTCQPQASAGKIAYGNGRFLAVGLMSTDGTNWFQNTTPTDWGSSGHYSGIAYQNGVFLIVGAYGHVATSTNGTDWTYRFHGTIQDLYGVTYGGNEWIAVGNLEEVVTSTNGIDWLRRRAYISDAFTSISYGRGLFVAATGGEFGLGELMTTSDTVNWNLCFVPNTPNFYDVVNGDEIWVAVGASGLIWASVGGTNWQTQTSGTTSDLTGVAYAAGQFVVVGDRGIVLTSSDAANWSLQNSGTTAHLNAVAYGQGRFTAVGVNGTMLASKDGSIWQQASNPFAGAVLTSIAYGDGRFVVTGYGGLILSSSDGALWTRQTSPTTFNLLSVAHGEGGFLVVGEGGVILQSIQSVSQIPVISISSASQTTHGSVQLTVVSTPGLTNIIQVSNDLKNWSVLANPLNANGTLHYEDVTAHAASNRFYRIMIP